MSDKEYKLKLKQVGARKIEVISDKWSFVVDLKERFGGENSGPNPSELVAAAVASCEVLTGVVWASRRHGKELQNVEAEVTWEYGEKPERITNINVVIRNVADQLGDKTAAFKGIARGCTVSKTLKNPPDLELAVE
jgi:putative redox protein